MKLWKCLNLGPRVPYLGIFLTKNVLFMYFQTGIWKKYCHIWYQRPWICLVAKFGANIKILKFETKNAWFGYFWAGIWKQYCFKSAFLNQHASSAWPKMLHVSIFGLEFKKNYCHIWNQHPRICLIAKCRKKAKIPEFGAKFCLNVGPKMPSLGIFGLNFVNYIVMFEISAPGFA